MNDRTDIRAFGDELRDEFRLAVAGLRDGSLPQRLDELSDAVDAAAAAGSGGMEADSVPEAPEGDPPAFSVRWDPTLSDGDGGWAVYLPTEHLLSYDGAGVATSDISGLTVVQDADGNDTPWYSLDDVGKDAGHVWLVVTVPESGAPSAELSAEEGAAGSGEKVVNVCVAEIDRSMSDAAGGPLPVVRQSLSGALHLGSGGGGPAVPGNFEPIFAPDAQDGYKVKLVRVGFGFCPFGRGFYSGPEVDSSAKIESGVIYLEVQHPGPSGSDPAIYVKGGALSTSLEDSFKNRSDTTKTLVPLYSIASGAITVDYRSCMSLPMREL